MTFDELIGSEIFIALRFPIALDGEPEQTSFGAKLVSVEPSGIWIESEKLKSIFEPVLWQAMLEQIGPEGVDAASISYFLPFSQVRFILVPRVRLE